MEMRKTVTCTMYRKIIENNVNLKTIMEQLGEGYQEQVVASNIYTMAKKGELDKLKACIILRDYPNLVKFLCDNYEVTTIENRTRKTKRTL